MSQENCKASPMLEAGVVEHRNPNQTKIKQPFSQGSIVAPWDGRLT